jgi:NAD(P)H-dependent FMN reductase
MAATAESAGVVPAGGLDGTVRLALIIASTRDSRFGETVGHWFAAQVRAFGGFDLDTVDLLELGLPSILSAEHPKGGRYSETVGAFAKRVAVADAFVFVTPEFNHGYPASLKSALDAVYVEWAAKPATFVSYGGAAGGARAVEQLRQVLVELHAVPIRDAVLLPLARQLFDDGGALVDPERFSPSVKATLDHLLWWARALRTARLEVPYQV